jgi:hypothetical protein
MHRFAVINHKGQVKGYATWQGAKNAFSMAGWRQAKERGDAAMDAWADDQLRFDRVTEWDVRRGGSVHIDGITVKSMIA